MKQSSGNATGVGKKQKMKEWSWNPTCSSPNVPIHKALCGIPGTSSNVMESLLEDVRPAHFEQAHGDCLLVADNTAGEQICHK